VLLVEPEGIAFIGDIDLSGFGPYYGDASSNLADFRRSLARLPALPARAWITSHHRGVYTDRAAFEEALAAFAAKIDEREARLLQMLAAGPQTLDELVRQRLLYPPHADDLWIDCAEARSIGMHLDELAAAGRVVHEPADGRFRLTPGQKPPA
jgi:glyoxylase-like metal-dependent hydrolase (beta-lactamase superfamily II)